MNIEKNIIRFSLNHKYNNYKILFNKLNEENKRKVELSEQLKELSPRMQMKLNELVEIKSKILESKNLSFNYEEKKRSRRVKMLIIFYPSCIGTFDFFFS